MEFREEKENEIIKWIVVGFITLLGAASIISDLT